MPAPRFAVPRILLLVLGIALIGPCAGPVRAEPQGVSEGRIVVVGEGRVSATPDYAQINGGVTTRGKSVKEASDANSKLMAAVTATLQDAGIATKDIQTSRFSIQPIYTPADPHNDAKLSGYSVSNEVNVRIHDIGKVGEILDRLVTAGVTNVGDIEFLHSDSSKLLDEAREAAVADAKRKAEIYARAAGIKLGRAVWITEEPAYAPPVPMMRMAASAPAAPPMPISAGEDTLQVRITVGFATAD